MTVVSDSIPFRTRSECEVLDITEKVQDIISQGTTKSGVAFLFVPGSTAALTTMEYEPGVATDLMATLERLAPKDGSYAHEKRWHDGNGHSHVRAALIGPDLCVPIRNKKLVLGTWQQITFIELDIRPRDRTVLVRVIGG
jgi:secondary thiamine-phosphate synthase enzyme